MKNINKILALLLIGLLTISNVAAEGFPEEPMVIYGDITGNNIDGKNLQISDGDNKLLKEIQVSNGQYGTNKTFDIENKISISNFLGELQFYISGFILKNIIKGDTINCTNTATFQKGNICKYNLEFEENTIKTDTAIISIEDIAVNIDEVFEGKILEKSKIELTAEIGENISKTHTSTGLILVTSTKLEIIKKIIKDIIIISETKKEAIFIPENTNIIQENVIIEKPVLITNKTEIKNKISKDIVGAVDVPTNKSVTFDKPIRICTEVTETSISGLTIYSSQDGINWSKDNTATSLEINDGQICFNVNHLTSFAVTKETQTSSSSGGGSAGGLSKDKCPDGDYSSSYYDKQCGVSPLEQTEIDTNIQIVENTEEINNNISNVKRDEEGKIIIKGSDYIKTIKNFISNKKEINTVLGYKVLNIKGNNSYNKTVESYTKKIYNDIKLDGIRKSMIKHMDSMTKTFGILLDSTLDDNLIEIYTAKLKEDKEYFELKMKKLKRKDEIIRYVLEKRKNN